MLECPHCNRAVVLSELRRPSGGGYHECPFCGGMVRLAQPHAFLRRTVALILSAFVLLLFGVRNPLALVAGSLLLWVPMSIPVNMYCVYAMPLGLKPWTHRGRKPFDFVPYDIFGKRSR